MQVQEAEEKRLRVLALVEGTPVSAERDPARERFVWPDLVIREFLAAIAVLVLVTVWGLLVNAPLRAQADPGWTENPAKAPWYFLGLQELLVYFDPWLAGVAIPTLIVLGLMAIPYVDVNNPVSGEYALGRRKKAAAIFLFGFGMWFALILVGTAFRGPSWHFYWPWQSWLVEKHASGANRSLPAVAGVAFLVVYFVGGMVLPAHLHPELPKRLGWIRYLIVAFLLVCMLFVPVKIALRLVFGIKYVLTTPILNV